MWEHPCRCSVVRLCSLGLHSRAASHFATCVGDARLRIASLRPLTPSLCQLQGHFRHPYTATHLPRRRSSSTSTINATILSIICNKLTRNNSSVTCRRRSRSGQLHTANIHTRARLRRQSTASSSSIFSSGHTRHLFTTPLRSTRRLSLHSRITHHRSLHIPTRVFHRLFRIRHRCTSQPTLSTQDRQHTWILALHHPRTAFRRSRRILSHHTPAKVR